jgi:hypothetical protein
MSTSLHRTDVAYIWPNALARPSGVRLVYLDQNHWINLAKAALGRPAGRPYVDALFELREARRTGRAIFPLSLTHLMETSTIQRRQRIDVATVMEELSGFISLVPRDVAFRVELEAVLDQVTGTTRPDRDPGLVPIVLPGLVYAYGRHGRFRISNGRRDITEEVRMDVGPEEFDRRIAQAEEELNRGLLFGPEDDEQEAKLRADGWNPEIAYRIGDERAQAEQEQAARFDDRTPVPDDPTDYRRQKLRDVVRARYMIVELLDMLNESLLARNVAVGDVTSDLDSSQRLVDAMPSADVAVTLLTQYHRDPTFQWKRNHIFDIDALSVAVPYCDLVAADRQAVDALHRHGVPQRLRSHVVRDLDDLVELLTAQTG